MDAKRLLELELELRQRDPALVAWHAIRDNPKTAGQRAFIESTAGIKCAIGGNRSGKTRTGILDDILQARGLHPTIHWQPFKPNDTWMCWYATETFELLGAQGWKHFKSFLLYPGESELKLPTRNILAIGWQKKSPQIPEYLAVPREGGGVAEFWFKSYDQGPATFQSGGLDVIHLDEETKDEGIVLESRFRILERSGRMTITATPIRGAEYVRKLERDWERLEKEPAADEGPRRALFFVRLRTLDNPGMPAGQLEAIQKEYEHWPEMLRLRLEGYALAVQGLVYNSRVFGAEHVCEPFRPPHDWALYRWIDHGWRNCACVWLAVSPSGDEIVLYRSYKGQELTIAENAAQINRLSGGERYIVTGIDRATLAASGQRGNTGDVVRVIDIWAAELGTSPVPSPPHEILAGVETVIKLLSERGPEGKRPRFRVARDCEEWLEEKDKYRWRDAQSVTADDRPDNPVKRDDHLMDATRYGIVYGLEYVPPPAPLPPEGVGRKFLEKREGNAQKRVRL